MDEELKKFEKGLDDLIFKLKDELAGIRAGMATTKLVEDIKVNCYGQELPIKQLANISIKPPREIEIIAWDKTVVNSIVKSIEMSSLGFGIRTEANVVHLSLPMLTQERRGELTKLVKSISEQCKIAIRKLRDEINKKINDNFKAKVIGEDQKFNYIERAQDIVTKRNKLTEEVLENKLKEINE